MTRRFLQQKGDALKKLESAKERDEVDLDIMPLLDYINSLPDYYTTSSCSGRISLFHDVGSKKDSDWVEKWHRRVSSEEVMKAFEKRPPTGLIWFRYEPAILHIVAKDLEGAARLLTVARNSGFKKVGVIALKEGRNAVEISSTERVEVPIAENGSALVYEGYLRYLVEFANEQFQLGMKRLKRLEAAFLDELP